MCCSHYKTENLHRQGQNVLRDPLKGIITAFYTPSEISAYKDTIYKQADGLGVDGLPQAVSRRKSDDRTKLEVEDILHLMDVLDDRCLLSKMPKFVAHDPSRLPFYNTADLDMGLLSLRVAALEEKLSLLSVSSQHVSTPTVLNSDATSNEVSAEEAEEGHVSWAGVARDLHVGNFHQVVRASTSATTTPGQPIADQQKIPASRSLTSGPTNTQRVLRGKHDEQGSIEGIPRRIHAFVSRLKMISLVGSTT